MLIITGCSQVVKEEIRITTHIELTKDTLYLGEPAFVNYVLTNSSQKPIFIMHAGNSNNSIIDHQVYIINSENDTLQNLGVQIGSGISSPKELQYGEQLKYKLPLNKWGKIDKPGSYKLSISKKYEITDRNEDQFIQMVSPKAYANFYVVEKE